MRDLHEARKQLLVLQGLLAGAAVLHIVSPSLDPTFRAILAGALSLFVLAVLVDWTFANRPLTRVRSGFVLTAFGLFVLMLGLAIVLSLLDTVGVIDYS